MRLYLRKMPHVIIAIPAAMSIALVPGTLFLVTSNATLMNPNNDAKKTPEI